MLASEEKLILAWIDDARSLLHCHLSKANAIKRLHRSIGIISAVLSAIVGSSIFASIGKEPVVSLKIIVGLISLSATVLTSVISFLKLPEVAQQHQNSGNEYASIRKELELLLAFDKSDNDLKSEIEKIKKRWDDIRKTSIPISSQTIKMYKKQP